MINKEEIIIKVISGNATEQECAELNSWREANLQNELFYKRILYIWENTGKLTPEFTPNVDEAWKKLNNTILLKPKTNKNLYKIAAAIVIFICVGLVTKVILNNNTQEQKITLKSDSLSIKKPLNTGVTRELIKISSKDEQKEFFLQDSSVVFLNKNSTITYKEFIKNKSRLVFLSGEAYFDVVHKKEKFIVSTDFIDVKVIGTAFNIKALKNDSIYEVTVEEGIIEAYEIKNPKNKITLNAKEKCKYNTNSHTFTKENYKKKGKWWKGFFSKFKNIINRIKNRKDSS